MRRFPLIRTLGGAAAAALLIGMTSCGNKTVSSAPDSSRAPTSAATSSEETAMRKPVNGVLCYPAPEEFPQDGLQFSVTANGQEVGLYSDVNAWDARPNFGYFGMEENVSATIVVKAQEAFEKVEILPESLGITPKVEGNTITFAIDRPGVYATLVFDGVYRGNTLHLFSNPIDPNPPEKSTANIFYFGPGYHDLKQRYAGELKIKSGQTLYIDAGAVVDGTIVVDNARDAKVICYGMLMMSGHNPLNQYNDIPLIVNNSDGVEIGPLLINSHRNPGWSFHIYRSANVTLDGYKCVSTRYASTDGLDITNSQNITVKNSFIRSCDDCITIKGLGEADPADSLPNEKIHVSDTILWSDCNNAMVLGEESRAKYYKDISFRNIDVLFSFDDRDNHERLDERAVMTLLSLHGTYYSDVLFEDIRIGNCQRMICMTFKSDFWFGSILGDQTTPGGMSDVVFRNITNTSPDDNSRIANEILLEGWDKEKGIERITFENVTVGGQKVTADYQRLKTNAYVKDLIVR